MSDLLLAKPKLAEGFIDLAVGEAHVVREILPKYFRIDDFVLPHPSHCWEYPFTAGYQPLVSLLEEKYQHPVVITNGAKQGLSSAFYALKKMGKQSIGMMSPHWALLPPLIEMHGLTPALGEHPCNVDSYLAVAPNNPDGHFPDLQCLEATCLSQGIPLIHDAAYYSHTYLPSSTELGDFGDVQIYSISKLFGLSGLRIGYVVSPMLDFYRFIQEYIEMTTVGVSITSQMFLYDLLSQMQKCPDLVVEFENETYQALKKAKEIFLGVNPDILEVNPRITETSGMFAWVKVGPKADFKKSKVNVIDGSLFGKEGFVRINLAFNEQQMREIVQRLNSV